MEIIISNQAPGDLIADYVREVADKLRLRDWTIYVSVDPADEPDDPIHADTDRCATFQGTLGRRHANIWISAQFWNQASAEDRRQTLVHELILRTSTGLVRLSSCR